MVTAFHGLDAFSGKAGIFGLLEKARGTELNGSAELCASDVPVGTIGLIMSGECNTFYSADAYTEINGDGSRFVDDYHRYRAEDHSREWFKEFTGAEAPEYDAEYISGTEKTGRYYELLLRNTEANAVWYTQDSQAKKARVLGRALGLPVVQVDKNSDFCAWQVR